VRQGKRTLYRIGLRMDVAHGDNNAAVPRDAGEGVGVGPFLRKVRKCRVPEDVWLEPLHARILQSAGVLFGYGIPIKVAFRRTAREHPALRRRTTF